MKKIVIPSAITFAINGILFAANMIFANFFHFLPIGLTIPGGDCVEYIGFGVELLKLYTFGLDTDKVGTIYEVSFNFASLIIPLILIFVISFVITYIIIDKKEEKTSK